MRELEKNFYLKQESPVERIISYPIVQELQTNPILLSDLLIAVMDIAQEVAHDSPNDSIKTERDKKIADILVKEHPLPDIILLFSPRSYDQFRDATKAQNDQIDTTVQSARLEETTTAQTIVENLSENIKLYMLARAAHNYKGILDGYYTEHEFFGEMSDPSLKSQIDHKKYVCDHIIRNAKPLQLTPTTQDT